MKNRIISPSLLSANFTRLRDDIKMVEDLGIDRLHLDVMDGHFVPNLTFGPFIINDIRKITSSHLETHLMIENPDKSFDDYINAGSDTIIFHQEASTNIQRDIDYLKSKNIKAGIAINPNTSIDLINPYLPSLDYILVMSVYPGFGGQSFIKETLIKMKNLASLKNKHNFVICVDGGVNINTIDSVYDTGIDITIVGSGLYKAKDIKSRYRKLITND